ncbi:MAG TPA: dihydrodipicolinate synthase family protein [Methylomirabilota bacterium]|nr:dihydrodipicolinate synthase family protein [Methylomirabilota bacterium]
MADLKGICVPICTPFAEPGDRIDEGALRSHVDSMIDAGVHIVLSAGGTGEFAYMSEAERRRVHEVVGKQIAGRARFIVHASAINTRDAIENSKAALDLGADAIMHLPPYFEGPTLNGVMVHFERIARSVAAPLVVYNIPQNTNRDITPEIFQRLMEIDTIRYIKDSTGDFTRIQRLVATGGGVFNGGDALAYPALVAGCAGCIWGGVNAMPREAVRLYDLVAAGKLADAAALWQRMLPAQIFFWTHDYNPSVKLATNLRGGRVGACRMPLQPLGEDDQRELKHALAALGTPVASAA